VTPPTATLVIPAFNEEQGLAVVLAEICPMAASQGIEILVVDDGSSDATAGVAEGFPVRLERHPSNLGKGAAMRTGVDNATADRIVFIDADGTYPVDAVVEIADRLRDHDMVVAIRRDDGPATPGINRLGNALFGWMIRRLYGLQRHDPLSGLYGIRREHFQHMHVRSRGFGIEAEIAIKGASMGLSILEIPTAYRPRLGEKKLRPFSDGLVVLRTVWRLLALFNPLALFFAPGLVLTVVGVALTVVVFVSTLTVGGIGLASASGVLAGLVALLGIQMMVFGMAGAVYAQAHWYTRPSRLARYAASQGVRYAIGVAGAAVAAAGLVLIAVFAIPWASGGFQGSTHSRLGIVGTEALLGGLEVFLAMAFLGLFADALGDV
jgi:glycosyltransferase involved in cell wall biosynthesis